MKKIKIGLSVVILLGLLAGTFCLSYIIVYNRYSNMYIMKDNVKVRTTSDANVTLSMDTWFDAEKQNILEEAQKLSSDNITEIEKLSYVNKDGIIVMEVMADNGSVFEVTYIKKSRTYKVAIQ